jgi:hypothetical protein
MYKNKDGTFHHFEMRGGEFESWLTDLMKLEEKIRNSRDVFDKLDKNDINGTNLVWPLLDSFSHRLDRVINWMKEYRANKNKLDEE